MNDKKDKMPIFKFFLLLCVISPVLSKVYIAGLVGSMSGNSVIKNCKVTMKISVDSDKAANIYENTNIHGHTDVGSSVTVTSTATEIDGVTYITRTYVVDHLEIKDGN